MLFCLLAVTGRANTFTFWTTNGAAVGVDPVALQVQFITGTNQIEVRITNLQIDPVRETQAVASVDFLVQGLSGVQPTAIALKNTTYTNAGYVVNFAGTKDIHYTTASITTAPTNAWQIASTGQLLSGGTQISVFSGGSPDYLILGKSTNATQYTGGNNALTGHTPYLGTDPDDYISFMLTYAPTAGITANSVIDRNNMPIVDFGTTFATTQELVLTDQPEPATLAMMLGGIGLIAIGSWRRRKPRA